MSFVNKKNLNSNLENFKTSNVQDADEGGALPLGPVQGFVNAMDQPTKQTFVCCFTKGLYSKVSLQGGRVGRE